MDPKFPPSNISSSHHTDRTAVTPPDDSDTPDQPLVAGASTASLTPHRRFTGTSISVRGTPSRFGTGYQIKEKISNTSIAKQCIAEYESAFQGIIIRVNQDIRLPEGERIPFRGYLSWLIGIIHCHLICNQLDKAQERINVAMDALNDTKGPSYPDDMRGTVYYLNFHLLLNKKKKAILAQEIGGASALPTTTFNTLEQEMRNSLELAIRYENPYATMAGIVYNLSVDNTAFPPNMQRAFALVDNIYHATKHKSKGFKIDKDSLSILTSLFKLNIEHINDIKRKPPSKRNAPDMVKGNIFAEHTFYQTVPFMKGQPYFTFLTQCEEKHDIFYSQLYYNFLGNRELLFKYLQCSQSIILYTLLQEDREQFITCIAQLKQLIPENGLLLTRFLAKIPEYHVCTWVYGYPAQKTRPSCDTDPCQFDPLLSRETLDYIVITYLNTCQNWPLLEEYFNDAIRVTGGKLPCAIRLHYLELLIRQNRLIEALDETTELINEYTAMNMHHEVAMMTFKAEELENRIYAEASATHELESLVCAKDKKPETVIPEEQPVKQENVEELAAHLQETHLSSEETASVSENYSQTMTKAGVTLMSQEALSSPPQPVEPPPSALKKAHRKKTAAPVLDYNYFINKIKNEMELCSLHTITQTIDKALSIPTLTALERGRLLWRNGWAHKALAPNPEVRKLALSFFNRGLACAIKTYLQEKQEKQKAPKTIDMVHFLEDPLLTEFIYEGSYRVPYISLISDLYSAAGHCHRDLGNPELGRKFSDLADRIKPWRRKRIRHYLTVIEPKIKVIKKKP